jgi:hypothetical protein
MPRQTFIVIIKAPKMLTNFVVVKYNQLTPVAIGSLLVFGFEKNLSLHIYTILCISVAAGARYLPPLAFLSEQHALSLNSAQSA